MLLITWYLKGESWTIKKAECQRIDAFELWCWRRLLRVPWTARRSNQSILKETNPEYSLEGLMLKLQWPPEDYWKRLMLGKIEGQSRRERQKMRWLDTITDSMDMNLTKLWEIVKDRGARHVAVHRLVGSYTIQQLNNNECSTVYLMFFLYPFSMDIYIASLVGLL